MIKRIYYGIRTTLIISWFYGILQIKRSPFSVLTFLLTPLSLVFFIYILGGERALNYGIIGALISSIVSSSIIVETDATFLRIITKIQDIFVSSPVSPISYAAGLALSDLIPGLPGVVFFLTFLALINKLQILQFLAIFYAISLTWANISALGFFISTFARDPRDIWVYAPILTVVLGFISPVYYPITFLPNWAFYASLLSPTTYPAEIIRIVLNLSNNNLLYYSLGLLLYTCVLMFLAGKRLRLKEK
jgi:ABC-2 type transport system permease protein